MILELLLRLLSWFIRAQFTRLVTLWGALKFAGNLLTRAGPWIGRSLIKKAQPTTSTATAGAAPTALTTTAASTSAATSVSG